MLGVFGAVSGATVALFVFVALAAGVGIALTGQTANSAPLELRSNLTLREEFRAFIGDLFDRRVSE